MNTALVKMNSYIIKEYNEYGELEITWDCNSIYDFKVIKDMEDYFNHLISEFGHLDMDRYELYKNDILIKEWDSNKLDDFYTDYEES